MPNIRKGGGYILPDPHVPQGTKRLALCLPDAPEVRQAAYGVLLELGHWFNWEKSEPGSGDTRAVELSSTILRLIQETFCWGEPMIRPDPNNPCVVQYSDDCGTTWRTLIDVNACVGGTVGPLLDKTAQDILDQLEDLYDGNSSSVAPDLTYGDADDGARDEALCTAWRLMVDTMIEAELERRAEEREFWSGVAEIMQDAAILVLGAPVPGARFISLGLALGAAALQGALVLFAALDQVVLNDAQARQNVACCGFDAMKGVTPTETGFKAALDACGFTAGTNSEALREAVRDIINEPNTTLRQYLGFLASWSDLLPLAKQGFLDCPCDDVWLVQRLGGHGNDDLTVDTSSFACSYDAANDRVIWGLNSTGATTGADISIALGASVDVSRVRVFNDDTGNPGSNFGVSDRNVGIHLYDGGVLVADRRFPTVDGYQTYDETFDPPVTCDEVRIRCADPNDEADGETNSIIIDGVVPAPPIV